MKRNKFLRLCGYLPCLTALLFMLFSGFETNAQSIEFCGEYHKPNNVQPTDSIYYTDRFGNFYTQEELTIDPSQMTTSTGQISVNHCAAGQRNYFHIMYDSGSFFTDEEKKTIECAFIDISTRIIPSTDRHLPNILIRKRDIEHELLASASSMYHISESFCDLEYSNVWKKLYTESKRGEWNIIDAIIDIDITPLLDWQLHNDPADPNKIDLFFIIQHQALHAMGMESRLFDTDPKLANATSRWDELLFNKKGTNGGNYLLNAINTSSSECKQCTNYSLPSNFNPNSIIDSNPNQCDNTEIVIGCQGTDEVNTSFVISNQFTLSHLCDKGGNQSMMSTTIDPQFDDKRISAVELKMLCALGYKINDNTPGVNFNCDPDIRVTKAVNYIMPTVMTLADIGMMVSLSDIYTKNGLPANSNFKINISDPKGKTFTYYPNGKTTNSLPYLELSVPYQKKDIRKSICGIYVLYYTIEIPDACDKKNFCKKGDLYVFIDCPEIPQCAYNSCNLVCDGNLNSLSLLPNIRDDNNRSNFDITEARVFEQSPLTVNWLQNSPITARKSCGISMLQTPNTNNSQYLRLVSVPPLPITPFLQQTTPGIRTPGYYFRLNRALKAGRHYQLKYRKFTNCSGRLNFVFSHAAPCQPMNTMGFLRGPAFALTTDCNQSNWGTWERISHDFNPSNGNTWDSAPSPASAQLNSFVPSSAAGSTYLIIFVEPDNTFLPIGDIRELFLDDIELYDRDDAQITIAPPSPAVVGCIGATVNVPMTITNTSGLAGTFILTPRLSTTTPGNFTLTAPAPITVNIGASSTGSSPTTITRNISVSIDATTPATATFDVSFDFTAIIPGNTYPNACLVGNTRATVTMAPAAPMNAAFMHTLLDNCPFPTVLLDATGSSPLPSGSTRTWRLWDSSAFNPATGTNSGAFIDIQTGSINTYSFSLVRGRTYELSSWVENSCGTSSTGSATFTAPMCGVPPTCACPSSVSNPVNIVSLTNPDQGEVLLSQVTALNGVAIFTGCMTIRGTLVIDRPFTFLGANIIMQPGAKIQVNATNTTGVTIDNSSLKGCNFRWKGIEVSPNAVFNTINNTTIEDAESALTLRQGVQAEIRQTLFNKNYIGIDVIGIPTNRAFNIKIYRNTFDCTANLLPPTTAPSANSGKGWVGIRGLYAVFDIGQNGVATNKNTFKNMKNGFFAAASNVNSYFSEISDLVKDSPYVPNNDFTSPYTNTNNICHTGIAGWGSMLQIFDNNIKDVSKGIHVENSIGFDLRNTQINSEVSGVFNTFSNGNINIFGDNPVGTVASVTAKAYGYRLFDCANANVKYNNIIYSLNYTVSGTVGYFFRIEAANAGSTGTKRLFTVNAHLNTKFHHLSIENDGRYRLLSCYGSYTSTNNAPFKGIGLINSNGNTLVNNNITTNGNNYTKGTGYSIENSQNNILCCNQSTSLKNGVFFDGTCLGTSYRNQGYTGGLSASHIGLRLNLGTEIGAQGVSQATSNNNEFGISSFNTAFLDIAARHESAYSSLASEVARVDQSIFYVKNDPKEYFAPTLTTTPPIVPILKIEDNGEGWFKPNVSGSHITGLCNNNTSTAQTCGVSLTPLIAGNASSRNLPPIPDLIKSYASGVSRGLYSQFLKQEGAKWSLRELEQNPQYLGQEQAVDAFYVNTFNSNIRRFNDVEDLIAQFNAPNAAEQTQRDNLYSAMSALDAQIDALDIAYDEATISAAEKAQNWQQRGVLVAQKAAHFNTLIAIQDSVKVRTNSLVADATLINSYISPTNLLEQNEQKINAIYFKTLAVGNIQFSEADKAIINTMASRCPKIDGKGVYRARYLQSTYDNLTYNDEENCLIISNPSGGNSNSKISNNKDVLSANDIKVYPNPTRDLLNIEIANSLEYEVLLRDITGRIVHQQKAIDNIQISVHGLSDGLYFCEFWQNNKNIAQKKVVIIH